MATPDISAKWPATQVEMVPIDDLIPYIRNPRQHTPEQIGQLAASMREFGWTMPVLRDEVGTILAGHGRILAARKLGLESAPVMTARDWTPSKKRAYVIADNKLALNASWDTQLLSAEIDALAEEEFPLELLGFSEEDLARMADDLMADQFETAQEAPATEKEPTNGQPRASSAPEQVALSIPMTVAQREGIFEAIQKAKREYSLDQSAEALWQICKNFLEQQ